MSWGPWHLWLLHIPLPTMTLTLGASGFKAESLSGGENKALFTGSIRVAMCLFTSSGEESRSPRSCGDSSP